MTDRINKIEPEIDLVKLFKTIWRQKIVIVLIIFISLVMGLYHNHNNPIVLTYEVSVKIRESKSEEYIKFLFLNKILDEQDFSSINEKFDNDTKETLTKINPKIILDKFINEILDYEEIKYVLENDYSAKDSISQLSKNSKHKVLHSYAKSLRVTKDKEFDHIILRFNWHNRDEIVQIFIDTINLSLLNLENSVYKQLEDILGIKKTITKIREAKKLEFLSEQSQIAKELGIADSTLGMGDNKKENSNTSGQASLLNIVTTENMAYYFRGYKAIDKEISLIKNREHRELKLIQDEINSIKKDNTNWVDFNALDSEIKTISNDNRKNVLVLSLIIGLIISLLYVFIYSSIINNIKANRKK